MKTLKTEIEQKVGKNIENIFLASPDTIETRLENFTKYVRRQPLKRFLAFYEIFKHILPVKGSIVECGVYKGFSLMAWAKLSTILEPENLTRRIYGFDTFEGFPSVQSKDQNSFEERQTGEFASKTYQELLQLIKQYDEDRFLGHLEKIRLILGDMVQEIPRFIQENPHLVVSLLFLDCDLYEPTKAAIENFLPRMPKGAVLAFDELDNPRWPGETLALLETKGLRNLRLQRIEWDPYLSYVIVE